MTRKIKTVIGALRHTLAALAERRGLRLTVGGDTASTNGKVVNLPVLPEEDEVAALLAEGYVDHEAAHVRWTNFSVPNNRWFNILEDVRIERLQGETYPGAKINLRRLAAALAGGPEDVVVPPDDKPIAQFQAWLLARERRLVLGHDALGGWEQAVEEHCRKRYGNGFCDLFVSLADRVAFCQSTQDCADLADKIMDLIKNPPEPPSPPPKPKPKPKPKSKPDQGEGEGSEEGEDGEDESEGGNAGAGSSADQEQGNQENQEGDSGSDSDLSPDDGGDPSESSPSPGSENSQSDDGNDADEEEEEGDSGSDSDSSSDDDGDPSESSPGSGNSQPEDGNDADEEGEDGDEGNSSSDAQSGGEDADPSSSGPQNSHGAGGEDTGPDSSSDDNGNPSESSPSPDPSRISKALKALANAKEEDGDSQDLASQLEKALNEIAQSAASGNGDSPLVIANESPNPYRGATLPPKLEQGMREAVVNTSRMKAQLAGLLQAARRKPSYPRQIGTRIDPRSCHLIAAKTPENRVFQSRHEKVAVNTAVTLLLDRSGSMNWAKQDLLTPAIKAAYATSVALSRVEGVVHNVVCYEGLNGDEEGGVTSLKKFEEKPRPEHYSGLYAGGGTPIAEALMWAGMVLTHRHLETRRIVVLFTDGEPNDPSEAERAVGVLRKSGVEVYAVFFGRGYNRFWIDEASSRVLEDIQELPKVFITLLKQTLLGKAKAA